MIMASWGPVGVPFPHSSSRLRDKLGFYSITKRREKPLRLVTLKGLGHEIEVKYIVNLLLLFIMKNSDEQRKIPYSFIIFLQDQTV